MQKSALTNSVVKKRKSMPVSFDIGLKVLVRNFLIEREKYKSFTYVHKTQTRKASKPTKEPTVYHFTTKYTAL
jgi:hypothetical protein